MRTTVIVVVDDCVVFSLANNSCHAAGICPGKEHIAAVTEAIHNAHECMKIELSRLNDSDRMSHSCCAASQIDSDIPVAVMRDSQ